MSLLNFIKARLNDVHNDAQAVGHAAGNVGHAVGNVVHAGGNVVNAGATTARDIGGASEASVRAIHQVVLPTVAHAADFIPQFALNYSNAAANLGRTVANHTPVIVHGGAGNGGPQVMRLTPKQQFTDPLTRAAVKETGASGTGKQLAGDVAQIGLSTLPGAGKGASLLTKTAESAGLGAGFNAASAAGNGATAHNIVKSAEIGGLLGAAVPGAGELVAKGARTAKAIATAKPFRSISDHEITAANRVSMARNGYPNNVKPGDIETYRGVQHKLGVDVNNHTAVDNVIGARMTYDTRMSQRPKLASLKSEGGGKGTNFNSSNKLPHQNFEQEYADALKQMESHATGGQMIPDGEGGYIRTSEHSPFYRQVYANTGRAPTKADWLAESQRQLRSGKADSYAQAEYANLKSTAPSKVTPATADALKQSKVEDAPTAISDALLAKQAKLEAVRNGQDSTVAQTIDGGVSPSEVQVAPTGAIQQSRFPTRLLGEERTAPIKPTLEQLTPYKQLKNQNVLSATQANIDRGEEAALTFAKRGNSTEANATAVQLINKYLSEGEFEKAADLTRTVNPRFTRQGQETQILAAYGRLTPVGAVRYAQKEIDNAIQNTGKGQKLEDQLHITDKVIKDNAKDVAKQLDDEIKSGKLGTNKGSVGGNGGNGGEGANHASKGENPGKTPEERLAARIKATTAKKTKGPDPVTDMVNTLHKVAKEILPESDKANIPRDPMELIGKAVKDANEYHGVYDRAKAIVMERYKDNHAALEELDKYFGSDIKRTYSKTQLNAGVQSGLKGVDLSALVKQHFSAVDETGQDLKTKLIERAGLNEADATQLSGDIQKRYNELVQQRKDSIIKQIFGDHPKPTQKTQVDRIIEMQNLGALSRDELRPLVGAKLNIPNLTSEATAQISKMADAIQKLPDGSHERNLATADMLQFIAKQVPQSKIANLVSVWKASLLSGVKTLGGNIESNEAIHALRTVADLPTVIADKSFAVAGKTKLGKKIGLTGERTATLSQRGQIEGLKESWSKLKRILKTGVDERHLGDKYEQYADINFKNPLVQKVLGDPGNGVFRIMGAADQPTFYPAFKRSLYDQAKAMGINKKLSGDKLDRFMTDTVKNAPESMLATATREGKKSVLDYDTYVSRAIQAAHRGIDQFAEGSPAGKAAAHTALNIIAPFVRVPSAYISRTIDFTPLGIPKTIFSQVAHRHFDQRAMSQAIGEATTGAAVIALGIELSKHGLLSGDFPKNDQKEQARWKTEKITPNSVKVGNKWISLNYLGPVGLLFGMGRHIDTAKGESGLNKAGASLAGLGSGLLGQSFLTGFSGFSDAIQDPQRNAKSFVNSQAGSIVPAISNDVATGTDKFQRQSDSPLDSIKSRVPGLREHDKIKRDAYGNPLDRPAGALDTLNPLKPSNSRTDYNPVIKEVSRLHGVDPSNSDLQVTPTAITDLTVSNGNKGTKTIKLNSNQKYALNNKVGQAVQQKWGELIKTPEYKGLDDTGKAKALSNLRSDITTLTERQYVLDDNLGVYNKSPARAVQALGQGNVNLADYATNTQQSGATGVSLAKNLDTTSRSFLTKYNALSSKQRDNASYSQNGFDYQAAQAKYANDVANGSLSKAGLIKAQSSLAKEKVGAGYSRDVRDLYGLSNGELSDWLATAQTGIDKKTLSNQIIAYGDALANAGVVKQNKYRNKAGAITLGKTSNGSSRSRSFKTASIPRVKGNPYKTNSTSYKQTKLPTIKTAAQHRSYKIAKLSTNINAKLRKA